jgi:CBS domain-containing protein
MHDGIVSCSREMPLRGVAALMARHEIHAVVVFTYGDEADVDRQLYGIVSDRDIADAFAAAAIEERTAGDGASEPILAVDADEDLRRAAQLLAEHGTSHLVVMDPNTRRPVGVLSTLDLARHVSA